MRDLSPVCMLREIRMHISGNEVAHVQGRLPHRCSLLDNRAAVTYAYYAL